MSIHSKVFEDNSDLMVTYTTDPDKYILHKINTDEFYDSPVDLINGIYESGERIGEPKCRFEYEEIDKPEEVVEEINEEVENDATYGSGEDDSQEET